MLIPLLFACAVEPVYTGPQNPPIAEEEAEPAPEETALDRWTFAVFMNGDNDLEEYVTHDLNELERVGSTPGVNVVVQADRSPGYDDSDGDWTGTRRYLMQGDDDLHTITSPVLEDLGELDMGDPQVLSDFLLWANEAYPAEHLAVVLWDHGDGWTVAATDAPPPAISYDDSSGSWISIAEGELAAALAPVVEARGLIDVVAFDACNMATWEVAHALREHASYLVASEATVGSEGLQYGPSLAWLRDHPDGTAAGLADNLARRAVDTGGEWTFSATDLSRMDEVAAAVDALAAWTLADPARQQDWLDARGEARAVEEAWRAWYIDLGDLAAVASASADPDLALAGLDLMTAVRGASVAAYGADEFAWTSGLTVFTATRDDDYLALYHSGAGATWSAATRWDDLLLELSGASER